MATDIKKILENLFSFFDFRNKTVISVGAGGGQFIEYGRLAKHVIAIDNDTEAIAKLETNLQKSGLSEKFTLINSDFFLVNMRADVVLFEFSLHEMDAEKAIDHALTMAPEVLVADHWPGSEWAFLADEVEKVFHSWEFLKKSKPAKIQQYDTRQHFENYDELFQKVKAQGSKTIQRIEKYKWKDNITIPMSYGLTLIQ